MSIRINREILRLAVPNIISNVTVPLLSTVDTALMGRMSAAHIGAVGVGSMIFNFVYWNFGFLRMGTTGMTAQRFGAKDDSGVVEIFGRAMLTAFLLALMILVLQVPFGNFSFSAMSVIGDQRALVGDYFFTRVWAAPATLALYGILGWFFGLQNAIYPLVITIFINIINIALSYYLVVYEGMGVKGAAWGTVIAQYSGLLIAVGLIIVRYRTYFHDFSLEAMLHIEKFLQFLRINADIFIRTFCLTFAFAFFYSRSAFAGELVLASNVILLQFVNWMSYGIDGFAFAAESLIGKYYGAKEMDTLKEALRKSFMWGLILALAYTLLFLIYGKPMLYIFSNQQEVIDGTQQYLIWVVLFPLISFACYIWDGVYIGLTASRSMRNSMAIALLVYLAVYYLTRNQWPATSLWLAMLIFMAARGIIQSLLYYKYRFNLR